MSHKKFQSPSLKLQQQNCVKVFTFRFHEGNSMTKLPTLLLVLG